MREMAFFDRFKKKRTASVLPSEVDEYYRTEKRGRRGAAFLLGLMTLILTVLLVLGVFFIGRFFYNKVTDKDSKSNTSISSNEDKKSGQKSSDDKSSTGSASSAGSANASSGSSAGSGSTSTGSSASSAPASGSVPRTGDNLPGTSLPRTGDEGL